MLVQIVFRAQRSCSVLYAPGRAGAASLSIFWGPVVGAKVVSHRTAVILQVGCQIIGNIVLGPHYLTPYSDVLAQGTRIADTADVLLYALLCVSFALLVWHLLAYWQEVPLPPFTTLGNNLNSQQEPPSVSVTSQAISFIVYAVVISLAGSALISPGGNSLNWGTQTQKPPFVSGLGRVWVSWAAMPLVSCACVTCLMLYFRRIMRTDDSFYEIVWVG